MLSECLTRPIDNGTGKSSLRRMRDHDRALQSLLARVWPHHLVRTSEGTMVIQHAEVAEER